MTIFENIGMAADDTFGISCFCGCAVVVRATASCTPLRSVTCSGPCRQLRAFLQGLLCGHALGCLLCSRNEAKTVSTTIQLKFDSSRQSDKKSLVGCLENESDGKKASYEADLESNHEEEMLHVAFEQNDSNNGIGSDTDYATWGDRGLVVPSESTALLTLKERHSPVSVSTSKKSITHSHRFYSGNKQQNPGRATWQHGTGVFSGSRTPDASNLAVDQTQFSSLDCGGQKNKLKSNEAKNQQPKNHVECTFCGKRFFESHLYVHMRAKHSDQLSAGSTMKFSCSECRKTFVAKSHLNKHVTMKHNSNKTVTKSCTLCHKTFTSQIGLSVHMRQAHQALSPKECDICQKSFQSCKALSKHKLHDHKLRAHVCHLCGKNFAYGHALKSHLDAHAGVKKHFCEVCGEGFVRMTSLCGHRISAHSKKDIDFKCDLCDSGYGSRGLLNKHLFESHLTGPYAVKDYKRQMSMTDQQDCLLCKAATEDSKICPVHQVSEDIAQFVCSHCGKKFSRSHYLKAHEKQHQVARFSCDVCCKRFTYKCNLKAHRSTHFSEKPFQCSVCHKTFRLKFLLEDHQRLHNQESLFKCYVCGKGLTRIPNLKRHIKVMHPEVNYEQNYSDLIHQQKHLSSR